MKTQIFEFKAKVNDLQHYERKLLALDPVFIGTENQTDTYFRVKKGRLKLRETLNEKTLINYFRENTKATKKSEVLVYQLDNYKELKEILTLHLGVKVIVKKERKIYEVENVRFHLDNVKKLGYFMEVEVKNPNKEHNTRERTNLCNKYFDYFELTKEQIIPNSYSDLLEGKN